MDYFDQDEVISALKGSSKISQRPLYSLWKHFPGQDLQPTDLVKAHIEFQDLVKSDVIKISPHSKYCLVDFGLEFNKIEFNKETGSYITKKYPIHKISDWEKIDEFDPQTGELGKQLEVVEQLSKEYSHIPTMMTVFLPAMIARKLVKDDNLLNHFYDDERLVLDRFNVIVKVMTEFARICLENGSTGLFLATQETDKKDSWTPKLWSKFAYPYDKKLLDAIKTKSEFQVLHLHGEEIFFKEVLEEFDVTTINFHSFKNFHSFFSSKEIFSLFRGGLLGGLEDSLFTDSLDKNSLENQIDTLIQSNIPISSRIILSPNCVLPQGASTDRLRDIITKIRL